MSKPARIYLSPKKPLLDAVVEWLSLNRLERTEGVPSLAHVMVVVPTAQSGRSLRLALAKRLGGVLPPKVVLPMQLVACADEAYREATDAELMAAFLKFLDLTRVDAWPHLVRPDALQDMNARLSLWDQLSDIWRVLFGGGLLMSDVLKNDAARQVLEGAAGEEVARWQELSNLESTFFDFLHTHGVVHPVENARRAKMQPRAIAPDIREVILPALADPVRLLPCVLAMQRPSLALTVLLHADEADDATFDDWGRPITACWISKDANAFSLFTDADIVLGADTSDLAHRVVADFPVVESPLATPSLALVDGKMFPDVASAFLNAGYVIHNPERHPLAVSSLGRLVRALVPLYRPDANGYGWASVVQVLRADDVLKALVASLSLNRAEVLAGIDIAQNRFLPQFLPLSGVFPYAEISHGDAKAYAAFSSAAATFVSWLDVARKDHSLIAFLRQMLKRIFAKRMLAGGDGEDEFREAAACVWSALDALESQVLVGLDLSDVAFDAVVLRTLDAAFYSLEPDAPNALRTEGWLELSWSAARQFALVGFHEGAVPDALVGHAFIPDGLRRALGLTNNDDRLARDTWLFKELLDSHVPHAVRAYVAKTDNAGEICRPSRLLYRCPENAFPTRVKMLFGDCNTEATRFPREVAPVWRLRLPDEVSLPSRDAKTPEGRLSASAIDQYIRCPFTYLLKFALGMKAVEGKDELGFDDFGTIVHKVLEVYAKEQIACGANQLSGVDQIRAALARIVKDVTRTYGESPSVNIALQLDALAGRINLFAPIQAQWAQEGWRIVERPEYSFLVQPFDGDNTWIKGSVDRIDYHPDYGYRIIDYKTWDDVTKAKEHFVKGGAAHLDFALKHHFPLYEGGQRLLSVQLPLYARCLEKVNEKFRGRIADACYLVLGKDKDNVGVFGSVFSQGVYEVPKSQKSRVSILDALPVAMETAWTAVRHIKENLFWPPGPGEVWKSDFARLFVSTPEQDMGEALENQSEWIRTQHERLEACR